MLYSYRCQNRLNHERQEFRLFQVVCEKFIRIDFHCVEPKAECWQMSVSCNLIDYGELLASIIVCDYRIMTLRKQEIIIFCSRLKVRDYEALAR